MTHNSKETTVNINENTSINVKLAISLLVVAVAITTWGIRQEMRIDTIQERVQKVELLADNQLMYEREMTNRLARVEEKLSTVSETLKEIRDQLGTETRRR